MITAATAENPARLTRADVADLARIHSQDAIDQMFNLGVFVWKDGEQVKKP